MLRLGTQLCRAQGSLLIQRLYSKETVLSLPCHLIYGPVEPHGLDDIVPGAGSGL